jgi:RNA polymerase primary sigma factor
MASKTEVTRQTQEASERDGRETPPDGPLLDLSDAAVKKLIHSAKKRGYVTHEQINVLSKELNSEQIEDVLAVFSEMGVNVVETEEATEDEGVREEAEEEAESGDLVEVVQKVPTKSEAKEPIDRTDDPVRMYLREMGAVELLSREGEVAIAKRIEAGREAMIAGLCESPLTFQAIIIWRDELNEGKVFLRDIIDLEATYAGPDAKAMPAPVGPDGQPLPVVPGVAPVPGATPLAQASAPPAAPASATPFKNASTNASTSAAMAATAPMAARAPRARRRLPARATSTTTIWRIRSRLPPSRPSSSPRCWRPSTTSPTPTSGCAACRTRTSSSSSRTPRSRRRRSAATRSSRTTSSPR